MEKLITPVNPAEELFGKEILGPLTKVEVPFGALMAMKAHMPRAFISATINQLRNELQNIEDNTPAEEKAAALETCLEIQLFFLKLSKL